MAGRRKEITPELVETLCSFIRLGLPIRRAAESAGMGESTYYSWMSKGEKGEEPYVEFVETIRTAEAEAQKLLIQKVQDEGGPQNWQWILERRWPEEWGRKDKLETEHKGEVKFDIKWPDDL